MKAWALGLSLVLMLSGINAEAAKRFGGGSSFGKQSSNVTQRQATPRRPQPRRNQQRGQARARRSAGGRCGSQAPVGRHAGWFGRRFGLGLVGQFLGHG